MKKLIPIFASILIIISSCTGIRNTTRGMENESFIEIFGNTGKYSQGVTVQVDENAPFTAQVNKPHPDRPKGTVYAISPGKHVVSVTFKDVVIYKKQIFISSQETLKIDLQD
jgi:hypothetical protein